MAQQPTDFLVAKITPNRIRKQTQLRDSLMLASVKKYGILDPLRITSDGKLIDGHCRMSAAIRLGITSTPCVVYNLNSLDSLNLTVALNGHPNDILASIIFKFPEAYQEWSELSPDIKERHIVRGDTLADLGRAHKRIPKIRTDKDRNKYLPYAQTLPMELQTRLKHILRTPLTREQAATLLTLLNNNIDINNPPPRIIDKMIQGHHVLFSKI
jgi:ParB-like chromosome segregation protein Spo0J